MKTFRLAILVLALSVSAACASGTEQFGNAPLGDGNFGDWPGILPVINDPNRIYQSWVNGNENFYFAGDTASLNQSLRHFAAVKTEAREVVLRPAPGVVQSFSRAQTM